MIEALWTAWNAQMMWNVALGAFIGFAVTNVAGYIFTIVGTIVGAHLGWGQPAPARNLDDVYRVLDDIRDDLRRRGGVTPSSPLSSWNPTDGSTSTLAVAKRAAKPEAAKPRPAMLTVPRSSFVRATVSPTKRANGRLLASR